MAASGEFQRIARDYLETFHRLEPVAASWLGIHSYDDRLGDLSAAGFQERRGVTREFVARLAGVDARRLAPGEQVEHAYLMAHADSTLWRLERVSDWQRDPDLYAELPLIGLLVFTARDYAPLDARAGSAIGRLRQVSEVLKAGKINVANPPRIFTETAIETCQGGLEFLNDALPRLAEQVPRYRDQLLGAAQEAARAYEDYLGYLRESLLPQSNGEFAVGKELYDQRLQRWHLLDLDAERLALLGRQIFEATRSEMERLAVEIDPKRTWPQVVADARQDHPAASELLEAYRRELQSLKAFIRTRDLVSLPADEEVVVDETPLFMRPVIPYAAYMPPGAFEADQVGQFWVTPVDPEAPPEAQDAQLQEHNLYAFPITALHEAYPGHHVQLVCANRSGSFVRKHGDSDLFAEGWAFYCEQLFAEQGYYRDPRMRLFQLKDQLWRAARIVIDVGLQTGAMTIDQGVRLLVDQVHLSEAAARAEVRRYAKTPTQPISYAIGKHEILRLREEFRGMPLREFHDALLACGTLPLKLVADEMRRHRAGG